MGHFDPPRLSRIPGRYIHVSLQVSGIEQRIKEICQTRVRYGYRRVYVLLRREGWGLKKTRRIYRELGLRPSAGSKRSCVRTAKLPPGRMRPGRWTSCMISWPQAARQSQTVQLQDAF